MRSVPASGRTRIVVEAALSIALAAVLHLLAVWQMPQGGNVSLAMLPIFVFAIRRGAVPGLACGAVYGLVDLWMEPYIAHPVQVVLDYPLAFALCGLAGLAATRWRRLTSAGRFSRAVLTALVPGVVLGSLGRYAAHVTSGVIFFGAYAPEGQPVLAYSLAYNAFVLVSAAACLAVAIVLLPPLERLVPSGRGSR